MIEGDLGILNLILNGSFLAVLVYGLYSGKLRTEKSCQEAMDREQEIARHERKRANEWRAVALQQLPTVRKSLDLVQQVSGADDE